MENTTNNNRTQKEESLLGKIAKGVAVVASGTLLGFCYSANSTSERMGAILGGIMTTGFVAYIFSGPTDYESSADSLFQTHYRANSQNRRSAEIREIPENVNDHL